ncbi:LAMI_0H11826g1_1 [Lachancea mirantina]|uniref:Golgi apparatus membrane protein TVP23 n=1 Tax=Lachancea mirantina TaxID=1230905 RepID=A0A1G4KHD2_9SACH|nr:LAMI_0H11826g1_1 [Lachancea mirantina]
MDHARNFYQTILKSSHPLTLSFHIFGKAAPIVLYLIGSWFMSFTAHFIAVLLLLAVDFYITKNITGRKLVQLRWWYNSSGTDKETFTFESYKQYPPGSPINPIDSKLFWWSLYVAPGAWMLFGVFCVLQLRFLYLILVAIGVSLTGWNAQGFRSCGKWDPNQTPDQFASWMNFSGLPNFGGLTNFGNLMTVQNLFQRN